MPRADGRPGHRRAAGLALAAAWACLAAACGGGGGAVPEARIYRIAYAPPAAVGREALPVTLGIALLGAPETYRQERLVYRTLPHQVGFYPYDRWETPPAEMVTDALIGHLRASGLFRRVVPYTRDGRVDYVLRGRLLRFDEEDAGPGTPWTAVVELDFQVLEPVRGEIAAGGVARASVPVPERRPASIVEALSAATREALGALASQVAASLRAGQR